MSVIAAIATPRGTGGISVIRISGEDTFELCNGIFTPTSTKKRPSEMEGYTCAYGKITDGGEYIDDCVLTVFCAPKSYTGEDVAEISCHGGIFVTNRILQLIFRNGAVPAEPGEFTKRAFLNGKMNLIQAEAVMNIISAEGRASHCCAAALKQGAIFGNIDAVAKKLLGLLGELGAWVDYPEEDIPEVESGEMLSVLEESASALEKILRDYDSGKIIREGVDTVIVGKPNVGKSTLMNLLSGCERSIVTDIAGTTRDIVEESVTLGDIVLRLSDTAGIRKAEDIVEKFGVERANAKLDAAELVLAVFDNSEPFNEEDEEICKRCEGKKCIALINKTDKEQSLDVGHIEKTFEKVIYISARSGEGTHELEAAICGLFGTDGLNYNEGILANERQRLCVQNSLNAIKEAVFALNDGYTLDAVNILIDEAENYLLELTGEKVSEAVVNEVFSHFCVGK